MASEGDAIDDRALRESARHRGLTLVKSRRRKAGGDFGKYGLTDSAGKQLIGFGEAGLTASAADIEAFLRGAMRSDWKEAAKGLPKARKKAPRPKPAPTPKLRRLKIENMLAKLPKATRGEVFTQLAGAGRVRVERIVSGGQATPEETPLQQAHDEWVVLLAGSAAIRFEDSEEASLKPGDHLMIPRGTKHWVTRTDADQPTIWLAVHFG